VQARAGTTASAQHLGAGVGERISLRAAEFLSEQRLAVIAGADPSGAMWASLLMGAPGFLRAPEEGVLEIAAVLPPGDPLAPSLSRDRPLGVLVIDLRSRRRLRVNGRARFVARGLVRVAAEEVFWNCPKYIQSREFKPVEHAGGEMPPARSGRRLEPAHRSLVEAADTLFVASANADRGADASHRGGLPGFVRMDGEDALVFPDYAGNGMFQTLGNFSTDGRAGLLLPDFERARTLQLTGHASIEWEPSEPGAERRVRVRIERWVEQFGVRGLPSHLVERSPYNPKPRS
jgi:predicted pyridoxine 5'-phosphate oxidase superfamily flavin-nucleotide-binding protein